MDAPANWQASALLSDVQHSLGGRVVLLDWSRGRVLADVPVQGAMGIVVRDDEVSVASWNQECIVVLRDGETVDRITHPWFNHMLGMSLTDTGNYLVASAGSDLVAEIGPDGQIVWAWFGPEHSYDRCPDGASTFCDRRADYRTVRPATSEQATHVTSATQASDKSVLATLFHQGQLIAIDRTTGDATIKVEGLSRPHAIHRRDGGFLLSDTLGHRIILLDEEARVCSEIPFGSQWLQDTIATSAGTYLTLENVHLEKDPEPGLTNRIVEIDARGRMLGGMDAGPDFRLFAAWEVGVEVACKLEQAWGHSADLDNWRRI